MTEYLGQGIVIDAIFIYSGDNNMNKSLPKIVIQIVVLE